MYKKVLVAYDGSEGSKAALERAVTLACAYDASLTMVWVRAPLPHHAASLTDDGEEEKAADEFFENLKREASEITQLSNRTIECLALYGDAAHEIVDFAEKKKFDLIVCGQTGHSGIINRLLGGTADRISETAKCDVLIVHLSKS